MANTSFYREAQKDSNKITWKEILSECTKKHSKKELEYAMTAGTSLNTATEADMLDKWRKPWVFLRLLIGGLILLGLLYVFYFGAAFLVGSVSNSLDTMTTILPPIVIPFILMIFIWELNIPRNISIYQLLIYLVVGGMLCFLVNSVFLQIIPSGPDIFEHSTAAFREEPAKLIASLIFLILFARSKDKKVYGLTGLVIGAAVGSGFSAFESITYSLNNGLATQFVRIIYAIGGHTVYCAPYVGAIALHTKNNKITTESFLNSDFLGTFCLSMAIHFIWNADIGGIIKNVVLIVISWIELLYITRKCLQQAVDIGMKYRGAKRVPNLALRLIGISGALTGAVCNLEEGKTIRIGRSEENSLRYPGSATGISRKHCSIRITKAGWALRDAGSTYGTYLNGNNRLKPGEDYILKPGDTIYLGGKGEAFRVEEKQEVAPYR